MALEMKGMRCLPLRIIMLLLCGLPSLSIATADDSDEPGLEILDEPELLEMLSGEALSATAVTQELQPEQPVIGTTGRLFGEKTIMVVRIETLDANSDYCDEDCAWKLMFGPDMQFGLQPTLDAATREASYGQMWFSKSKSAVVTVRLQERNFSLPCHFGQAGQRARELVKQMHGKDPDSYDFVYHFLPNNMGCNFGGVAFLFRKYAFSAPGYTRNGIIKHEVGHNYGLVHARALGGPFGSPGKEDGWDTGSSMGGGVIFGTAERYMLGWISGDAVQDLGEIPATNGGDSKLPGDPRLMAYWDRASCGPMGNDYNWGWCGHGRGICPKTKAVSRDICPNGQAKLHFMSQRDKFYHHGCQFYWFAQYACTGPTTTTTTTTTTVPEGAHDVLVKVAAARHPLDTPHGPHTVIFSLWKDAVFALSYRTPHGTDGASMRVMRDRFAWVVDHKVNIHRLHGGRKQGRGFGQETLYAGVGASERFVLGPTPVSHRGNFTLEVCSADDDQAVVSILFHAGSNRPSKCPPTGTTTTTTTTTMISTVITTTSMSSTTVGLGIQSGDTIFLKTRSGKGNHIDVEGSAVQARWESQGSLQAIVIERENGGTVSSGDIIYLKSHTGAHIDVTGDVVQARWNDHGGFQAMRIAKRTGSGAILPGDSICLKSHTGKHLDVEGSIVKARWNDCSDWQAMSIQKEVDGALFSGASIHLLAHTGKRIEVEGTAVKARWTDAGIWQTFTIQNYGGRAIFSGDAVFLKAHTGKLLDVEGVSVQANWKDWGEWQKLIIEKSHHGGGGSGVQLGDRQERGSGAIMPGDKIFLRAHTGKMIDVQGEAVQARYLDRGTWQALEIEKLDSGDDRRLAQTRDAIIIV